MLNEEDPSEGAWEWSECAMTMLDMTRHATCSALVAHASLVTSSETCIRRLTKRY
jgi:hypothetical protein